MLNNYQTKYKMDIIIYAEQSQQKRLQMMQDNCTSKEVQPVKIWFSEDDLAEMKSQLSDISIDKNDLEDELKEMSSGLKVQIKEKMKSLRKLLFLLKCKYEMKNEEVYLFEDQENKTMLTYNHLGELIDSRKLRPSEQTSIINLNAKTA